MVKETKKKRYIEEFLGYLIDNVYYTPEERKEYFPKYIKRKHAVYRVYTKNQIIEKCK